MGKPRRRDDLERLGEKPGEMTPAEELQEEVDLLAQQEPEPPPRNRPLPPSDPSLLADEVDPHLNDPAD
jgi:hypothetical protein